MVDEQLNGEQVDDQRRETMTATAMQVLSPGASLTAREVPLRSPSAGHVRLEVAAAGMCGNDIGTAAAGGTDGAPATPGHEIAGTIAQIGAGVKGFDPGDRVAVGWFGGSCGQCRRCRCGDVVHCPDRRIPGVSYPGGWARTVTVPAAALARIPDELADIHAAPMGCAGVTTFNAVRRSGAPAGSRVAVFGLGGLGHLAVQFAAAMGHEVIAIARGPQREHQAYALGAHDYIDNAATAPGAALREGGGAAVMIATAPDSGPLPELLNGLQPHGRLVLLGTDTSPLELSVGRLVSGALTVAGHLTGSPLETEEAMRFAVRTGLRPVIELMPLEAAQEALERLRDGSPRFRIVLDMTQSAS